MENAIENLGQTAAEKVDATRPAIADALEGVSSTVRRNAGVAGGNFEDVARETARALGMTAGYIRTHDARQMICDAEQAARRNPVPALAGAAAVGFLLGALLRR